MHSFIVNNILLNELASRILMGNHAMFKKFTVSLIMLFSLTFYGLESLFKSWKR